MFSKTPTELSMKTYSDKIKESARLIRAADRLVIGVGSGLSAAGGLCYTDPALVKKWYPEYYELGLRSIGELQQLFWVTNVGNPERYWGYWARHIWHIRYESEVTAPYLDLHAIIEDKDYFIITTNADSQVDKAGFRKDKIFAMQGNYEFFQCSQHCSEEIYQNREMVEKMIRNMPNAFEICKDDIPLCPNCGAPLIPNLRADDNFVETPHMGNLPAYEQFLLGCADKNTVFLELGVGFNTPIIIRYPFEAYTNHFPKAHLIRINDSYADVPKNIEGKSVALAASLSTALHDILLQ